MQDNTKKLAACEASLKRWHSRLTRAVNAINGLQKQRRRLLAPRPLSVRNEPPRLAECERVMTGEDVTIPAFLNRADPLIAEKMTAARKKAEEAARHKMPLTGRAAIDAIMAVPVKPKRKRKTDKATTA